MIHTEWIRSKKGEKVEDTEGKEIVDEYNIIAVIVPTEEQMQRLSKNNGAVETVEEASKPKSAKTKTKNQPKKKVISTPSDKPRLGVSAETYSADQVKNLEVVKTISIETANQKDNDTEGQ